MLTMKHIDVWGKERILSVREVEFKYAEQIGPAAVVGFAPSNGHVRLIFRPPVDGQMDEFLYDGSVYVMNEAGKTISKYDLGGWAQPAENTPGAAMISGTLQSASRASKPYTLPV